MKNENNAPEKAKYTSGPWNVRKGRENVFIGDSLNLLAAVYPVADTPELFQENQANCKLISAAPELLEAAQYALACLPNYGVDSIQEKLINAIKKATE